MLEHVTRRRLPLPESGVEIALLDWGGQGPLALLHHANGFCAALWDLVARPLTRHFRVIGMDARGHGDSSAPAGDEFYRWASFAGDLVAVADALAAEHPDGRVHLGLGHSFGGTSMILASRDRPHLFEKLVLVDPVLPPAIPDGMRAERVNSMADRARKRRRVFDDREDARASWQAKDLFAGWRPEAFDLYLAEGLRDLPDGKVELKCAPDVEAAIFQHGPGTDLAQAASQVPIPTCLLWATRGDFPRALYETIVAGMPHAEVRDVDAGHLVPMEHPELVVAAVLSFTAAAQRSVG